VEIVVAVPNLLDAQARCIRWGDCRYRGCARLATSRREQRLAHRERALL